MTVVGKILAGLNLVFSLIVGAFAVLSYTASSNHAEGGKQWKERYEVQNRTSEALKKENDELREQQQAFRTELASLAVKQGIKDVDAKQGKDAKDLAVRVTAALKNRDSRIAALESQLKTARS